MRNVFIIGMLGVAAFMAGWFTIDREGESTRIEINRSEIRSDARRAIEKGREILDRREQQQQQQQPYAQDQVFSPQSGPTYDDRGYPFTSYGSPYPAAQYPAAQYPATEYPAAQYPATEYPAAQYPAGQYPSAQYPGATYPPR